MFPRDILPEWITKCSLAADAKFGESAYGCECYLLTICFRVKKNLFISQNNSKTEQLPESCLFNGALCLIFTLKKIQARLFHFNDILQQFKFVNWRIREFDDSLF